MVPTPEWFFGLMITQVVPVVLLFMIAGTALGLVVKSMKNAARQAFSSDRRPRR